MPLSELIGEAEERDCTQDLKEDHRGAISFFLSLHNKLKHLIRQL